MTTCWSCQRPHTGYVWCPHCSAPVDTGSKEAERSLSWQQDPRNRRKVGLGAGIEAYQALLEGHRAHPDDDEIAEDLDRAKAAMEVAWLEHVAAEHRVSETAADSRAGMQSYRLGRVVSHHLLRHRARAACARLNTATQHRIIRSNTDLHYVVCKAKRGPWRYRVEEWRRP